MSVLLVTFALFLVFSVFFFVCDSGYYNGRPNWDELAIPINVAPSRGCVAVTQIDTDLQCFYECMKRMRHFYMFSRQTVTLVCFCCKDTPNVPFQGLNWKTFRAPPCPEDYTEYSYDHRDICLRYSPEVKRYPEATTECQADGGDLIRVDSQRKMDIFKDFVSNSTNSSVQVWVQGIKVDYTWLYHDGSPIGYTCMIGESNETGETRMRAQSVTDYGCHDAGPGMLNSFVCEIYRVFSGF